MGVQDAKNGMQKNNTKREIYTKQCLYQKK